MIGMGWDIRSGTSADFDLDSSAFVLDSHREALSDSHFVFFNNLASPDGAIIHSGDNLAGQGDGDDEVMIVSMASLPDEAHYVLFAISIFDAAQRGQDLTGVANLFVRICDLKASEEAARFDVPQFEPPETGTVLVIAELARSEAGWCFHAIGDTKSSLLELVRECGVDVG